MTLLDTSLYGEGMFPQVCGGVFQVARSPAAPTARTATPLQFPPAGNAFAKRSENVPVAVVTTARGSAWSRRSTP